MNVPKSPVGIKVRAPAGKIEGVCVSLPQNCIEGAELIRLVTVVPKRSQPGMLANRAAGAYNSAAPRRPVVARSLPRSSRPAPPCCPATCTTPISTARRCAGISKPTVNSTSPRTMQSQNQIHRDFMTKLSDCKSLAQDARTILTLYMTHTAAMFKCKFQNSDAS
jgi:hypothetical protein